MTTKIMDQFKGAEKWLNPTNVILVVAFYLAGNSLTTKLNQIQEAHDYVTLQKKLHEEHEKHLNYRFQGLYDKNSEQDRIINDHASSMDLLFRYSDVPPEEKTTFRRREDRISTNQPD